jgi:hypothetical protein
MNDLGTLLAWLALIAVLSLMDAAARRRRARSDVPDPVPTRETGPRERPEPVTPETEAEWRELRPRPVEVGTAPDEEAALPPVIYVPLPPEPEAIPEEAPPLITAAEEIRERARRELAASVAPPLAPSGMAAPEARRRPGAPAVRGSDRARALRALLRGGPDALRTAMLYREVLGPPPGAGHRRGGWEDPLAPRPE